MSTVATENQIYKTHIVAVPLYVEEAFKPIQKLIDDKFLFDSYYRGHGTKTIEKFDDYQILIGMLEEIHNLNTEYYMSCDYAPQKQPNQNVQDYLANYLKNKGLNSYYTFREWYDIFIDIGNGNKEQFYIIPLYIRLKNGKSFDQMKTIRYVPKSESNKDGFVVEPVNPKHFIRDPSEEDDPITEMKGMFNDLSDNKKDSVELLDEIREEEDDQ